MSKSLIVVPTYLSQPSDLDVTLAALESLRATAPNVECYVVDDASPAVELVDELEAATSRLEFDLERMRTNEGFSRTVNVGLRRALECEQNAVLVNADIQFTEPGWLEKMEAEDAAVVGALLTYPNGLIQHGGVFFSLLHRCFDHIYKYAPGDLPEAQVPRDCPVTGALQFIRYECMEAIGLYDEGFRMGWEDVDYCIRAWQSGRVSRYQPTVKAIHHESLFRGRPSPKVADWQARSWLYFMEKHRTTSFAELVPSLI